jgi:hypothetical protein
LRFGSVSIATLSFSTGRRSKLAAVFRGNRRRVSNAVHSIRRPLLALRG